MLLPGNACPFVRQHLCGIDMLRCGRAPGADLAERDARGRELADRETEPQIDLRGDPALQNRLEGGAVQAAVGVEEVEVGRGEGRVQGIACGGSGEGSYITQIG